LLPPPLPSPPTTPAPTTIITTAVAISPMFSKNNLWFCEAIVGRAWHQYQPMIQLANDIFDFDVFHMILTEVLIRDSVLVKNDIYQYLVHKSKIVHYTNDEDDDDRYSEKDTIIESISSKVSLYVDIFCIFESQVCTNIFRMHEQLHNVRDFLFNLPEYSDVLLQKVLDGNKQICMNLCKNVLKESDDLKSFLDELSEEQSSVWHNQLKQSFEFQLKSDDEDLLLELLQEYM
jgi:hypothetical protein